MSAVRGVPAAASREDDSGDRACASAEVALSGTLAVGILLAAGSAGVLLIHPSHELAFLGNTINQQNQNVKTAIYLAAVVLVLPLASLAGPALAGRIVEQTDPRSLQTLTALLAGGLATAVIAARVLPFGGLEVVLAGTLLWGAAGAVLLARATRPPRWPPLERAARHRDAVLMAAGVLWVGVCLCLTRLGSLSPVALVLGTIVATMALRLGPRIRRPRLAAGPWRAVELASVVILLLAIPNVVIFHASPTVPNLFAMPGIVQSQHDFFLGPVNQLMAHGALLVNAPGSQYGVGDLYLLAGWFHLVPIGYGTFGLLDGILTSLFYLAGYLVLRLAGVRAGPAVGALAFAIAVFVLRLQYPTGVLPEMGPLRFGMPLVMILIAVGGLRATVGRRRLLRAASCLVLGVASLWSFETFVYTAATLVVLSAAEAWLLPAGRGMRLLNQALGGVAGVLVAQLGFAAATLAGSGHLPHWDQYFAYIQSFVLGGKAGEVTYGFDPFSPALALGGGLLVSAIALVVVARRDPRIARSQPARFLALSGTTGYAVAIFSYIDNRSSTYLLPYLALPALLVAVLWLGWPGRSRATARERGLLLTLVSAVAILMLASAWPTIGEHFADSALAHVRPGGGLTARLDRLLHPPPIDPRAPAGEALLGGLPGRRPVVLLADAPDLAIEILMRRRLANGISIGDTGMDSYVPSDWTGRIGAEIDRLAPGTKILTDRATLSLAGLVAGRPGLDPVHHPLTLGGNQMEWILQRLGRRFRLVPVGRGPAGFVMVALQPR